MEDPNEKTGPGNLIEPANETLELCTGWRKRTGPDLPTYKATKPNPTKCRRNQIKWQNPTKRRRKSTQTTQQLKTSEPNKASKKPNKATKPDKAPKEPNKAPRKAHWKIRQDQVKAIEPGLRTEQETTKGQNTTSRSWTDKSYQNELEVATKLSNPTMLLQHLTDLIFCENKLKEFQLMISPFPVIFFRIDSLTVLVEYFLRKE